MGQNHARMTPDASRATVATVSHSEEKRHHASGIGHDTIAPPAPLSAPICPNRAADAFDFTPASAPLSAPIQTHFSLSSGAMTLLPPSKPFTHASKPSIGSVGVSGRRSLARKLSLKGRKKDEDERVRDGFPPNASVKALKTLGHVDLKIFEAMVEAAEARAGIVQDSNPTLSKKPSLDLPAPPSIAVRTPKSSAFTVNPPSAYRSDPAVVPTPATPAQRPPSRRPGSSTSPLSSRGSVKSARRAEREWRARVAALSASATRRRSPSIAEPRGPVPPKRTPGGAGLSQRSPSPETEVATPDSADLAVWNKGTQAKSIASSRSFETLGHHRHMHAQPLQRPRANDGGYFPRASPWVDLPSRNRKPSVPQSVSSFYFDPTTSSTRPSSLALSTLLSSIQDEPQIVASDEPRASSPLSVSGSTLSPRGKRKSLPPFDQFTLGPISIVAPLSPPPLTSTAAAPISTDSPVSTPIKTSSTSSTPWTPTDRRVAARSSTQLTASPASRSGRTNSLPPPGRDAACPDGSRPAPPPEHGSASAPILSPGRKTGKPMGLTLDPVDHSPLREASSPGYSAAATHAATSTPNRPTSSALGTPSTPYSPMTAFILSAPSIDIAFSDFPGPETPSKKDNSAHPFAVAGVESPAPPLPPKKTTPRSALADSQAPRTAPATFPRSASQRLFEQGTETNTARTSFLPPVPPPTRTTKHRKPLHPSPSSPLSPAPLRARAPSNARRDALGASSVRQPRKNANLTPGMESGNRPPKSGMPIKELTRWLEQTSLA